MLETRSIPSWRSTNRIGLTWPLPFLLRPLDARFLTMIAVVGDYDFEKVQKVRDVAEFPIHGVGSSLGIVDLIT